MVIWKFPPVFLEACEARMKQKGAELVQQMMQTTIGMALYWKKHEGLDLVFCRV